MSDKRARLWVDWLNKMPEAEEQSEVMVSMSLMLQRCGLFQRLPDVALEMLRLWCAVGDVERVMLVVKGDGSIAWTENFEDDAIAFAPKPTMN